MKRVSADPPVGSAAPVPPAQRRVPLCIAGQRVDLRFDPELGDLGDHVADLWSHLVSHEDAAPLTRGAGTADGAPHIELEYVESADPARPRARTLARTPGAGYAISGDVTRALISALRGSRLLLHSGIVDHPRYGVIVLVGPSGAGKSTATTVLGQQGGYLTDELGILDPQSLAVTAYAKPVSRAASTESGGGKRDLSLPAQGLHPVEEAPAPSMVLLLDRIVPNEAGSEGAAAVGELVRVPLSEALPRIIEQSSSLWQVPRGLAALAHLLDGIGGALRVRYREAEELPELLAQAPPALVEEWEELPPMPARAAPGSGEVAAVSEPQAVEIRGGVLVLVAGRSVLLDGLVLAVWDQLARNGPSSPDEIEEAVVAQIGPHPDSVPLIASAIEELVRCGLAERG